MTVEGRRFEDLGAAGGGRGGVWRGFRERNGDPLGGSLPSPGSAGVYHLASVLSHPRSRAVRNQKMGIGRCKREERRCCPSTRHV